MNTVEQWAPVKGFDSAYEVSDQGRVRSLHRIVIRSNGWPKTICARVLKPGISSNGYLTVALCVNGKPVTHSIHLLVALAFIPNPREYPLVDHRDRDRTNNSVNNLRWSTYSANGFNTDQPTGRGIKYVARYTKRPWIAVISRKSLGHFSSQEEAMKARCDAVKTVLSNTHR